MHVTYNARIASIYWHCRELLTDFNGHQRTKRKGKKYEGGNMENDYSGDCQYSDGSPDGTRNDLVYGLWPILKVRG